MNVTQSLIRQSCGDYPPFDIRYDALVGWVLSASCCSHRQQQLQVQMSHKRTHTHTHTHRFCIISVFSVFKEDDSSLFLQRRALSVHQIKAGIKIHRDALNYTDPGSCQQSRLVCM